MPNNNVVVAHDAGGAELLASYVKSNPHREDFLCFVQGPAEKIFARRNLPVVVLDGDLEASASRVVDSSRGCKQLLASIGWSSPLESRSVQKAKAAGIKTIVYLDHWIHYRERFGYPHPDWEQALPDALWVGDEAALEIALRDFPHTPVQLEPNQYFKEIVQEFTAYPYTGERKQELLFLSEPISENINTAGDKEPIAFTEFTVLRDVLQSAYEAQQAHLLIRFHPSEDKTKYDSLIKEFRGRVMVEVSANESIYADMRRATKVVGMESMALVVAALCGLPVASYLPDMQKQCPLPLDSIQKLHSIDALRAYLVRS